MSSASFPFAFRPRKKIDREFVRVLRQMANHTRALTRRSRRILPVSIHETRVLIKRCRALLWFAKGTLPASELKRARLHLRKASRLLASQRDLAVMRTALKKLFSDISNPKDRKVLVTIFHAPGPGPVTDKKSERSLRQATSLLLATIGQITQSAKTCSKWPSPSDRLAKAFHTTKKAGRKALHGGKAVQFHNWRKKAKRLLYQLQLTHPASNKRMERVIKQVDKLQNELGKYHDSVVTQDHLRKNLSRNMERSLARRAANLLEKRKDRLEKKARKRARCIKPK
jgi:CHAD domain-containing protein